MAQEPVTIDALKDFVDVFLRAENSGEEPNSPLWNQVEELGRKTIRQVEWIKRPLDVNPNDWEKAQSCLDFVAHSTVESNVTYVLGFMPVIVDTMSGNIEKMTSTWNMGKLSNALQYKFEYALAVHPLWITHDTLSSANARDIQLLLQALSNKKEPEPMWHNPEAMACEDICVRIFYMPVIYTLRGKMEYDWSPEDVYISIDENSKQERVLMETFGDAFTLHGEQETRIQLCDIGLASQVIHEAKTLRDLREIETRLEMLKAAVSMRENSEHEYKLEVQLTWGTGVGQNIELGEAPAIRFAVMAKNVDDETPHRMVVGVNVDPDNPGSWTDILQELLAMSFRVGWPNVQIKQVSSEEALNYWAEVNTPKYLM